MTNYPISKAFSGAGLSGVSLAVSLMDNLELWLRLLALLVGIIASVLGSIAALPRAIEVIRKIAKRRLILALSVACVASVPLGCASFGTHQTDISTTTDPDGTITTRTITTRAAARTLFSDHSTLAKWKATQTDKTQGAEVGSIDSGSTSTNLTGIAEAVSRGATAGAMQALQGGVR